MNPGLEAQAIGRSWRMGQLRPVTVHKLYIKDSVEERIMTLVAQRVAPGAATEGASAMDTLRAAKGSKKILVSEVRLCAAVCLSFATVCSRWQTLTLCLSFAHVAPLLRSRCASPSLNRLLAPSATTSRRFASMNSNFCSRCAVSLLRRALCAPASDACAAHVRSE